MRCSGKNCPMQYPYDVKACDLLETCPYATLIPYTNADRIRAMNDEELAKFLGLCESKGYEDSTVALDENGGMIDKVEWLQRPAEEET